MISPTAIKQFGSDKVAEHPIGTGPFKLKSYTQNVGANFVANPDYWGPKPKLAGSAWTFYQTQSPMILALQGGQVDMISALSQAGATALFNSSSYKIVQIHASLHRELAANVPLTGAHHSTGAGTAADRNVELRIAAPFPLGRVGGLLHDEPAGAGQCRQPGAASFSIAVSLPSSLTCAAAVRPSAQRVSSAGLPVTVTTGVLALAVIRTRCGPGSAAGRSSLTSSMPTGALRSRNLAMPSRCHSTSFRSALTVRCSQPGAPRRTYAMRTPSQPPPRSGWGGPTGRPIRALGQIRTYRSRSWISPCLTDRSRMRSQRSAVISKGFSTTVVEGRGTELSEGGMVLYAGILLNPGDLLEIEFETPAPSRLTATTAGTSR